MNYLDIISTKFPILNTVNEYVEYCEQYKLSLEWFRVVQSGLEWFRENLYQLFPPTSKEHLESKNKLENEFKRLDSLFQSVMNNKDVIDLFLLQINIRDEFIRRHEVLIDCLKDFLRYATSYNSYDTDIPF